MISFGPFLDCRQQAIRMFTQFISTSSGRGTGHMNTFSYWLHGQASDYTPFSGRTLESSRLSFQLHWLEACFFGSQRLQKERGMGRLASQVSLLAFSLLRTLFDISSVSREQDKKGMKLKGNSAQGTCLLTRSNKSE